MRPNRVRHAASAVVAVKLPKTAFHHHVFAGSNTEKNRPCRPSSQLVARRCSDYSGSRWQPSIPRPPQFLRGVSVICTVSAGPPEVVGRSALTVIGSCALLALPVAGVQLERIERVVLSARVEHSPLRSARQLLPPSTASRGSSSLPSQTW